MKRWGDNALIESAVAQERQACAAIAEDLREELARLRADYRELSSANGHLLEMIAELESRVAWLKKEHCDH